MADVAAHDQLVTHSYEIAYPEHGPREGDPHYADFHAWKERERAAGRWRCAWAAEAGDDSECDTSVPLQAHHSHIEFALLNAVDLARLEHAYPGISDPTSVGAWIETDANLVLLCRKHHIGRGAGIHDLDAALYEATHFLIDGTVTSEPVTNAGITS